MPINNQKGLEALRALSQGGTPALDAYNKAQGVETASRTSALDKALGGQDLGAAVAKAQAQYAPKVPTAGLNVADLNPAAENYLSRASDKLATQQYSDQQNLAYQAEALRRKENELTAEERQAQLLGAAELMGQKQAADARQNTTLGEGLDTLAVRKANLRNQLTAFDQSGTPTIDPAVVASLAAAGTPEAAAQLQALNEAAGVRSAERQAILDQMGALDQQQAATAEQYAKFLGTDTKGFQEAYAKADAGDTNAARDLVSYLRGTGVEKKALGKAQHGIEMGTQGRLRALAPAFGIDPLTAEGRFREGEGDDLARQGQRAKEKAYAGGELTPGEKKTMDNQQAADLGFSTGSSYARARNVSKMTDQEIEATMQSDDWAEIDQLATAFATGDTSMLPEELQGASGAKGFNEGVQNFLKGAHDVGPDGKQVPWSDDRKKSFAKLATEYFTGQVKGLAGTGETS